MQTRSFPAARAGRAASATLIVLALLALAACGGSSNPHPKTLDSYVALGDSYTAVAGDGPFSNAACRRAVGDYPSLVAKELGIKNFTDASCGGASTQSLTTDQTLQTPAGTTPPQLDALSAKTTLVTIGIGLNNTPTGGVPMSYALLYLCNAVNGVVNPACSSYLALPDSTIDDAIRSVAKAVKASLKAIRTAAPNARIILVGYPRVLADDADCPAQLPMSAAAASRLRGALRQVNQQYAKVADQVGVDYIDMWSASKGHDVCSSQPWVDGIADVPGKALQFHPYAAYHRAVADRIVALLKK